jgi:hypothetical protein
MDVFLPSSRRFASLLVALLAVVLATPWREAKAQPTVADIERVAAWARADGKPGPVSPDLVPLVGLGPAPNDKITGQHLTFRIANDGDAGYQFSLLPVNGRLEMLVWRRTASEMLVWRIDDAGRMVAAARADGSGARGIAATDEAALFGRTLAFFVASAPRR